MRWPIALCAAVLALGLAAPAHADADSHFIDILRQFNFDYHGQTQAQAISAGHDTCHALDSGVSFQVANNLAFKYFGHDDGATFMAASIMAFCPEYKDVVGRLASEGR